MQEKYHISSIDGDGFPASFQTGADLLPKGISDCRKRRFYFHFVHLPFYQMQLCEEIIIVNQCGEPQYTIRYPFREIGSVGIWILVQGG